MREVLLFLQVTVSLERVHGHERLLWWRRASDGNDSAAVLSSLHAGLNSEKGTTRKPPIDTFDPQDPKLIRTDGGGGVKE